MGNLFEVAKFSRAAGTYRVRQERIRREGSPYYHWDIGGLVADVVVACSINHLFPGSKKYAPLDWIELVNNSASNITLLLNGNDQFLCVAGTIRTVTGLPLHQVSVVSPANVAGGLVIATLQREPLTIDQWVRRQR